MSPPNERIAIGRVLKSVGVRGEICIGPLTNDLHRFSKLSTVFIGSPETAREFTVEAVRLARHSAVVKLKGLSTPEQASQLREQFVFVDDKEKVVPPAGSYFVHDIMGSSVQTVSGDVVEVVTDVLNMPAHDVWVINHRGKEILLPATKEIVKQVDVGKKKIVVEPLKGMLDDED